MTKFSATEQVKNRCLLEFVVCVWHSLLLCSSVREQDPFDQQGREPAGLRGLQAAAERSLLLQYLTVRALLQRERLRVQGQTALYYH